MRTAWLFVAVAVIAVVCAPAGAAEFPEQWFRFGESIVEPEGADKLIAMMERAKKAGYTHVLLDDVYIQTLRAMPQKYFNNIARVKKAADEIGIIIVPSIFNVGYSWRVLWYDSNLAAGLPVRDAPFLVKDGVAFPDPDAVPVLQNGGFEKILNGAAASWKVAKGCGPYIGLDEKILHGGSHSLRMTAFGNLPLDERGRKKPCAVTQTVRVKPFKYYRVTIWRKTRNLRVGGSSVNIASSDGMRRLCYTNFEIDPVRDWEDFVTPTSDWRQFQLTFNTLESTSVDITINVSNPQSGTVWWDDLKITPAGLANLLRGDTKPFTVKSADGSVVYEEGRDFIYVEDTRMGKAPMPAWLSYLPPGGSFDIWHEGPKIRLTPDSAIKEGDRLLVSYYHPHIIYGHQVTGSLTDPKVFDIFNEQMQWAKKVWDAPAYLLGYDEIRTAGWEVQPGGTHYTPGELLAKHVTRAVDIVHKYSPNAKIYIWSDMFDPSHNARRLTNKRGYYLCNGDFYGSWEGLPSEVRILKWGSASSSSIKFAADRGHKIVFSGRSARAVNIWVNAAKGTGAEILGFCYTDWHKNYDPLEAYAEAIRALPESAE